MMEREKSPEGADVITKIHEKLSKEFRETGITDSLIIEGVLPLPSSEIITVENGTKTKTGE